MPSTRRNDSTTGIDPPQPINSAGLPYSSARAACARCTKRLSSATSMPGEPENFSNATVAPGGSRSFTKLWNPAYTASGSCLPTSRNDTFADASDAITVFAPGPV